MFSDLPKGELGIWRGRGSKHWRSAYISSAPKPLSTPPGSRRSSTAKDQPPVKGSAGPDQQEHDTAKKVARRGSAASSTASGLTEKTITAVSLQKEPVQAKIHPGPNKDEGWFMPVPLQSGHMFVRRLPTLVTGIAIHGKKCRGSTCTATADWEILKGIKSKTEPGRYAHIRDEGDICDRCMRLQRSFWAQEAAICGVDP